MEYKNTDEIASSNGLEFPQSESYITKSNDFESSANDEYQESD